MASTPVGMLRVRCGAPSMNNHQVGRPVADIEQQLRRRLSGTVKARAMARLSGSKAITFRPIDSSMSSRSSTNLFGTLVSNISCLVLSVGESPSNAQSILDSASGVGISESAWYRMALASSLAGKRSTSATVVKTRLRGNTDGHVLGRHMGLADQLGDSLGQFLLVGLGIAERERIIQRNIGVLQQALGLPPRSCTSRTAVLPISRPKKPEATLRKLIARPLLYGAVSSEELYHKHYQLQAAPVLLFAGYYFLRSHPFLLSISSYAFILS